MYRCILSIVFLSLIGCANNKYVPPESGETSRVVLNINPVIDPGPWGKNISGSVFVYEDIDCKGGKFATNTARNEEVVIRSGSPVTIMVAVFYETNNYKKTT
ncbi:MAG: hypothetical protein GWO38_32135 [Phycisphaerae bacterium]|nr:hypothetical protein [Phycisphaerae bacterium]NIX32150.1 hypothetical protein [Phycisphaerae bacterium]